MQSFVSNLVNKIPIVYKHTPILSSTIRTVFGNVSSRTFGVLSSNNIPSKVSEQLLQPVIPSIMQSCGFKVRGLVKRRCKDCFLVKRNERLYNICKTHPRHKQMSMIPAPKNTWILTHATQSRMRPW